MKRKLLIAIPLLCAVAVAAWIYRPKHEAAGEGYIGERSVTLWSGVAQVREPLDALHYGDHVEIGVLATTTAVKVRTTSGEVGWIDAQIKPDAENGVVAAQRETVRRRAGVAGAGSRPDQGGHQSASVARPHSTSPVSIRARHPSGNCRTSRRRRVAQASDEKGILPVMLETGGKKTPKKKNGYLFEGLLPGRPAKAIPARRIPRRPRSPVIAPLPLPVGSSDVSWNWTCPTP